MTDAGARKWKHTDSRDPVLEALQGQVDHFGDASKMVES